MALFGLFIINKNYFDNIYLVNFWFLAIWDDLQAVGGQKLKKKEKPEINVTLY